MRKQLIAFIVAFAITGVVALGIMAVGVNAAVNTNSVVASNSLAQAAVVSPGSASTSTDAQVAQLQALVNQYQQREQQYQQALQQDQTQLSQATQEMQTIQQLLTYLQNHHLIFIDSQGNITVTGRGGDDH
jgi:hypothetical protein